MATATSIEREIEPQAFHPEDQSPVSVIFTSMNQTVKALEKAGQLAKLQKNGIEILAVQTVSFALPLDDPSVPLKFLVRRLEEMAARFPEQIRISAYLCRDPMETLKRVLNKHCPVIMSVRKTWWPTRDKKLAKKLCRAGYSVILVETE
jgi:hypothetical protein